MAGTKTLADLKARIADELDRPDLPSQIALAIDDAITEASGYRFWFNEARGLTFPTVAGTEFYTTSDISALNEIDAVYFYVSGQRRNMWPADSLDVDMWNDGAAPTGEPVYWARYGDGFRIYPVPNAVYTISIDGVSRLSALTSDTALNAWTNEGEKLVRAIAKRELLLNVIQDSDAAEVQQRLVQNAVTEYKAKSYDRSATGRMAYNG